jgi:hypothetical protein
MPSWPHWCVSFRIERKGFLLTPKQASFIVQTTFWALSVRAGYGADYLKLNTYYRELFNKWWFLGSILSTHHRPVQDISHSLVEEDFRATGFPDCVLVHACREQLFGFGESSQVRHPSALPFYNYMECESNYTF